MLQPLKLFHQLNLNLLDLAVLCAPTVLFCLFVHGDVKRLRVCLQRTGRREELLTGPVYYGLAHTLLTVLYWRTGPIALTAAASLCMGDGLADLIGRRYGHLAGRLPYSKDKVRRRGCCQHTLHLVTSSFVGLDLTCMRTLL